MRCTRGRPWEQATPDRRGSKPTQHPAKLTCCRCLCTPAWRRLLLLWSQGPRLGWSPAGWLESLVFLPTFPTGLLPAPSADLHTYVFSCSLVKNTTRTTTIAMLRHSLGRDEWYILRCTPLIHYTSRYFLYVLSVPVRIVHQMNHSCMPTLTRIKVMLELGIQIDSWADRGENIDMYACTCYRVNTSHPLTPQSHVETRRNLTKISTAKTIGFQKFTPSL